MARIQQLVHVPDSSIAATWQVNEPSTKAKADPKVALPKEDPVHTLILKEQVSLQELDPMVENKVEDNIEENSAYSGEMVEVDDVEAHGETVEIKETHGDTKDIDMKNFKDTSYTIEVEHIDFVTPQYFKEREPKVTDFLPN
ncbi:hypothetical protein NE237_012016 [Protea cynaroides]|uniref:Uncharacterized protein n=1 Tax=Protea cynaroides TaxID=273540 RepID=A0A9Q0JYU9_9MAGN|nr:hypothetical protein NE237_012016 [Protea cynaroides]